jgi:spectinomycin phosphotransferase
MIETFSDQRIIDCLNTYYGIKAATLTLLPLGADMNASVYKAQAHDQSSYFVKLKQGCHHDVSTTIVSLLHDTGIQQIIPPIKTTRGQSIQHIHNFTLIVYPFIDGQNGFIHNLTDEQWVTLGKVLKQVHKIEVPLSIQNQIRHEAYSPKWRNAVRSLYSQIEGEPSGDDIALKLLMFMKEHSKSIYRLVNVSEQLAKKIQEQSPEFVLCHADIHGGNVLIDEQSTIFVVDWDDPIMAPKERDLMFIGGGIANVWNNPHEEEFFYTGYGKTAVNRTILAYYRHERIVEDIALYGEALLLTRVGGEDRAEMYKQFIAMFEPRGVVDIAFKTDESLNI